MAELVYDVAPGSNIQFHRAFGGQAVFANGINELVANGSTVIVDDVTYFAAPFFPGGLVAQAADAAVTAGVPYFTSAGNVADQSYETTFAPVSVPDGGGGFVTFHHFDPDPATVDTFQRVQLANNQAITSSFQWDNPFISVDPTSGGAVSDYDIFVGDVATDTIVAFSNLNNIGGDPVELVTYTNTTGQTRDLDIFIQRVSGTDNNRI